MNDAHTCPTCHAPLPEGTDLGGCPRCLLAAGLEDVEAASGTASPNAPASEDVAALFPQLEILEVVGQGGMGVVYRARQRGLDRLVALKLLPASLADDPAFADRFRREARTMARLDHPHIVRVHDFGDVEGRFYLLMELVDGPNLREVIDRGGLAPHEALRIVPPICEALQYAHDQGVVHRDIKPENVLLDRDGHVKLTDFGLAKLVRREVGEPTLTRAGQIMGTPHYMAPEQYRTPDHVDHRADIYSLGVVLYEMLTGEVPMGHFEPPSQRVQVDVRLDEVVLRTLAREPEKRYQRADEVRTRVTSIAASPAPEASVAPAASLPTPVSSPRPRRLSRLALFGFLATLTGLGLPILAAMVLATLDFGSDSSVAVGPLGLVTFLLIVTGFALSLAGWIACARHRAELRGLGLAITGTLLPLVLAPLAFGWLLLAPVEAPRTSTGAAGTSGEGTPAAQTASVPVSTMEAEIRDAWAAFRAVLRQPQVAPADLEGFVERVGAKRMAAARPADVARMRRDEVLGLGGLAGMVGEHALADLEIAAIEPRPGLVPTTLVHLAKDGEGVVVPMKKEGSHWRFALGPVERLPGRTATWNTPDLLDGAPLATDERRAVQTQIELLFSVWQQLWEAGDMPLRSGGPRGILPWLLAASQQDAWISRSSEDVARRGKAGALGLLFLDAATLPARPGDYALTHVDLPGDGDHGVVTARTAEGATLQFQVHHEIGHWWFTIAPVQRAD